MEINIGNRENYKKLKFNILLFLSLMISNKMNLRIKGYNKTLKKYFKLDKLKYEQKIIIDKVVHYKRDVCAVLCTGFGKSITYQLPALITGKTTIIVSPLISLMNDQQLRLESMNIKSCCINSVSKKKISEIKELAIKGEYRTVYITPESVAVSKDFFVDMINNNILGLIAIDESHCISSWGFDFRSSYKELSKLRDWCPKIPILALTATATEKVRNDICNILKLKRPRMVIGSFDRPNLYVSVKRKTIVSNDIKPLINPDEKCIIYCKTRNDTEKLVNNLKAFKMPSEFYHAGMNDKDREQVQNNFSSGKTKCIIATVAFGMGIDVADIRLVIHYGCPSSLEAYYQEIGRAGRDKEKSRCFLFYNNRDFTINNTFINGIKDKNYRNTQILAKNNIEKYLYTTKCRRKVLLKYFGDESDLPDNCGNCDNCCNLGRTKDFSYDSYLCLSLINSLSGKYGTCMYIDILRGSKAKKIFDSLKRNKFYELGNYLTVDEWKVIIGRLIENNYLESIQVSQFGSNVACTQKAKNWLEKINKNHKNIDEDTYFSNDEKLLMFVEEMTDTIKPKKTIDEYAIEYYDIKPTKTKKKMIKKILK